MELIPCAIPVHTASTNIGCLKVITEKNYTFLFIYLFTYLFIYLFTYLFTYVFNKRTFISSNTQEVQFIHIHTYISTEHTGLRRRSITELLSLFQTSLTAP